MSADGIRIRVAGPEDVAAIVANLNERSAAAMTMQIPYTTEAERAPIVNADQRNRTLVAEVDGRVVGHIGLHMETRRRAHVGSLGMAVLEEYRGHGIGTALLEAVLDLADNWYNLLRMELHVYTDNDPAVRLYQRHGFVIEGTHRAYVYRLGSYVDAYSMARIRRAPRILPDDDPALLP